MQVTLLGRRTIEKNKKKTMREEEEVGEVTMTTSWEGGWWHRGEGLANITVQCVGPEAFHSSFDDD